MIAAIALTLLLGPVTLAAQPGDATSASAGTETVCRDFTSTERRNMRIRGELRMGMTREDVREALGRPREQHEYPRELWIYHDRDRGMIVGFKRIYFQDGCVAEVVRHQR